MVGRCQCGKFKFNLHNNSLTEIPWLCYECKDLSDGFKRIVRTLPHRAPNKRPVKVLMDIRDLRV